MASDLRNSSSSGDGSFEDGEDCGFCVLQWYIWLDKYW